MAMNEPMVTAHSGATHQKRALPNTLFTPAHWYFHPATRASAGVSGTNQRMHSAEAKVATASTTKIPRQDSRVNAAASGAVDSKAPMPPATIIQPASDACRSTGYQVAIALSGAMRQTETPAPINARAIVRPARSLLAAN